MSVVIERPSRFLLGEDPILDHAKHLLDGILTPPANDELHETVWHDWMNLWESAGKNAEEALDYLAIAAMGHQITFERAHAAILAASALKPHIQLN